MSRNQRRAAILGAFVPMILMVMCYYALTRSSMYIWMIIAMIAGTIYALMIA